MDEPKKTETVMVRIARFIVDKRNAFYLIFAAALIYSVIGIPKAVVNNDITDYLPEETETRRGLTIMDEEFTTYGSARLLVTSIDRQQAQALADTLETVDGVKSVTYDESEEHYKDAAALYDLTLEAADGTPESKATQSAVKEAVAGYDYYLSPGYTQMDSADLAAEMGVILAVAVVIIIAVLLFTSKSYMEVVVFLIVFSVAAILNMGTNFWFGSVSFVTNSIAVVLQLALAIDYAIIFCHRYMEERNNGLAAREADIAALSKAIVEISSSSLTTISGLAALTFMHFKIGMDMGVVLIKGIVFSMLTVFLLMPGLLMLFNRLIEKTYHVDFVPSIRGWGRLIVRTRKVLPILFVVVLVGGIYCSNRCDYVFSTNSTNSGNMPDYRIAADKIAGIFGNRNTIAVLVPAGDYGSEKEVLERVGELNGVTSATGLANIEVDDSHTLTNEMSPRQFAELTGVEIEEARLLYQAYGLAHEEYGAIFQDADDYTIPMLDIFDFLCEQMDKGVVTLSEEQTKEVNDLREELDEGKKQLKGEHWTRLVFTADCPEEGEETTALMDSIRAVAADYYGDDVILVGNSTSAADLASTFASDNILISILTILFVLVVLIFTFQSVGLPILLVLVIQGSIWINFSFPFLTGTNLFFLGYLVVSSIQMGATIDYAIVISNRYTQLKQEMDRRQAAVEAINQSFATVFTSGSIMTVSGFLIGGISTDPTICSLGTALGRGTLISIILVMTVLPQLLILGDGLIERTAITLNRDRVRRFHNGTVRLDGHIKGYISGYVDGEIKGTIQGSVDAQLTSREQPAFQPDTPSEPAPKEVSKP